MERGVWGRDVFLRVDPNEEIHTSIRSVFAGGEATCGAVTSGIGRVRDVDIGYLDEAGVYQRKILENPVELLSLQGNVAELDGQPFTHLHVVVSDDEHVVHGGHLFSAVVAVTAEIHIRMFDDSGEQAVKMNRCHIAGSEFKPLNFSKSE